MLKGIVACFYGLYRVQARPDQARSGQPDGVIKWPTRGYSMAVWRAACGAGLRGRGLFGWIAKLRALDVVTLWLRWNGGCDRWLPERNERMLLSQEEVRSRRWLMAMALR